MINKIKLQVNFKSGKNCSRSQNNMAIFSKKMIKIPREK